VLSLGIDFKILWQPSSILATKSYNGFYYFTKTIKCDRNMWNNSERTDSSTVRGRGSNKN